MSKYEVRYVGDWISYIYDNETKESVRISNEDFVRLLNKQDKQISDLEQKLALTEKALELACEEINRVEAKFGSAYIRANGYLVDYFKTKAKEMKSE